MLLSIRFQGAITVNSTSTQPLADGAGVYESYPCWQPRTNVFGSPERHCSPLRSLLGTLRRCLQRPRCAQFRQPGFEQPDLDKWMSRLYQCTQVPGGRPTIEQCDGRFRWLRGDGRTRGFGRPILELWRRRATIPPAARSTPLRHQIAELNAAVASRIYQKSVDQWREVNCASDHAAWQRHHTRHRGNETGASSTVVRVGTTNSGAFNAPVVFRHVIRR